MLRKGAALIAITGMLISPLAMAQTGPAAGTGGGAAGGGGLGGLISATGLSGTALTGLAVTGAVILGVGVAVATNDDGGTSSSSGTN